MSTHTTDTPPVYGIMAEFMEPEILMEAANKAYAKGYRVMDAYSPIPVEGLSEAVGFKKTRIPLMVLIGGIIGCFSGYMLQYWTAAIDYPMNVGGRPLNSVPQFVPVTFEVTVLLAALTAAIGMIILNGLPAPYHPVFNVPQFSRASTDRFFLCIEATDPSYDAEGTKSFLESLSPVSVAYVDH